VSFRGNPDGENRAVCLHWFVVTADHAHPVLLAENDENDILLFRRAFRLVGLKHPLLVVENGEEVLQYLAGQGPFSDRQRYPFPALLLLDLKMPKKSGFEVLEWIGSQAELRSLTVLILSSSSHASDMEKAYALGAKSYFVKPVDFDKLAEIVRCLARHWLPGCSQDKSTLAVK
jgi:CheY-like chemotaxis protein